MEHSFCFNTRVQLVIFSVINLTAKENAHGQEGSTRLNFLLGFQSGILNEVCASVTGVLHFVLTEGVYFHQSLPRDNIHLLPS